MDGLSSKQLQIYDYIVKFISENNVSPSVREIGAACSLNSPSTVHSHLKRLQASGLIDTGNGKKRAITLSGRPRNSIPVLGTVRAGAPILAVEDIEGYVPCPTGASGDDYFALRVKGDSMIDAGIFEGDFVVVRRQSAADHGDIVVALLDDEATVKRLKLSDGHVWLMPENRAYDPIDGQHAHILGKVTSLYRNY